MTLAAALLTTGGVRLWRWYELEPAEISLPMLGIGNKDQGVGVVDLPAYVWQWDGRRVALEGQPFHWDIFAKDPQDPPEARSADFKLMAESWHEWSSYNLGVFCRMPPGTARDDWPHMFRSARVIGTLHLTRRADPYCGQVVVYSLDVERVEQDPPELPAKALSRITPRPVMWGWTETGLTALLVFVVVIWGHARWAERRRERRAARGLCLRCGYDVRATPQDGGALLSRCPECGAVPAASKGTA